MELGIFEIWRFGFKGQGLLGLGLRDLSFLGIGGLGFRDLGFLGFGVWGLGI